MQLKVLSWNIWVDCLFDDFKSFVTEFDADIVGLQEVREGDAMRDVVGFMTSLGYKHVFAPRQIWHTPRFDFGPAIFSKYDIISSSEHVLSEEEPRFCVRADIAVDGKILHAFNTHLVHTHQEPSEVQASQARTLLELIPSDSSIVMGDFNALPDSEVIRIMTSRLTNTDPSHSPTWCQYTAGCTKCDLDRIELRLDYIFATQDLSTSNPLVHASKASDHLPISIHLEV